MPIVKSLRGGINSVLPPYDKSLLARSQCLLLQNLRCRNEIVEPVPGTRRYHGTNLSSPVTAIMPY